MLADEELGTSVEAKDLIVQLLSDIFGLGKGLHAGIVDDNVNFEKSARDIQRFNAQLGLRLPKALMASSNSLVTSGVLETLAWIATALPPAFSISATVASAGLAELA